MLDRLHYTVRAKTINRRMYRIEHVDQLYYVVDNDTLLCRQFPISIVAMRPECVLTDPVAIWDYGTISEACPTSSPLVIADSDEFLMLELRGRNVASDQLELGWLTPSNVARSLASWTTADQRRCSEHTLVLHRSDLPATIEDGQRRLADFHRRVIAELPKPLSHRDHPIWRRLHTLHHEWRASGGVETTSVAHPWSTQAPEERPLRERLALVVRGLYRSVFGQFPRVRAGHPYAIDIDPTIALIERVATPKQRAISVCSTPRAVIAPWLKDWFDDVRELRAEDIASDAPGADRTGVESADFGFVELTRQEISKFCELHQRLRRMVRRGGHIVVLYRTHGVESLAPRDISFIVGALPAADIAVVEYRGGWLPSRLQRLWDERLAGIRKRRRTGAVSFVITALLIAPLAWIVNRAAVQRRNSGELPRGCTSVLMDITIV